MKIIKKVQYYLYIKNEPKNKKLNGVKERNLYVAFRKQNKNNEYFVYFVLRKLNE